MGRTLGAKRTKADKQADAKRTGRPKTSNPRSEIIMIRLTAREYKALAAMARKRKMFLAELARDFILEALENAR